MQALRRAASGTRASSSALNTAFVHQQGVCAFPSQAMAQPLG